MIYINNLKYKRKEINLTQEEIAEEASISVKAYSNYELNKKSPNVYVAKKLANVLKTTIEYLFP